MSVEGLVQAYFMSPDVMDGVRGLGLYGLPSWGTSLDLGLAEKPNRLHIIAQDAL